MVVGGQCMCMFSKNPKCGMDLNGIWHVGGPHGQEGCFNLSPTSWYRVCKRGYRLSVEPKPYVLAKTL